jgi:hypothetical protein
LRYYRDNIVEVNDNYRSCGFLPVSAVENIRGL